MSILTKVFWFLFPHEEKSDQKQTLKAIAKQIKHNTYKAFYRTKTREVTPELGFFFHNLYKSINDFGRLLHRAKESKTLQHILLECCMDEKQSMLWHNLSAERLKKLVNTMSSEELIKQFENDTAALSQAFEERWIQYADKQYNLLLETIGFLSFNYFQILKKLDPNLKEQNLKDKPQFQLMPVTVLLENLKDFLAIAMFMDPIQDWNIVLTALKRYKESTEIKPDTWHRLLQQLQRIQSSNILFLIIRHGSQDPAWKIKPYYEQVHIAKRFIDAKQRDAKQLLDRLVHEQYTSRIDNLLQSLYASPIDDDCVRYYTEENNQIYAHRQIGTFKYTKTLSYVKAFITQYYTPIMELCNFLVLKGTWASSKISKELSNDLYSLENIPSRLERFEDALGEQGTWGLKLNNTADMPDPDKITKWTVKQIEIMKQVNKEALEIITVTRKSLIMLGKHIKNLEADRESQESGTLLLNWKELEELKPELIAQIIKYYKKMALFVHLIRLVVHGSHVTQAEGE